MKKLLLIDGHSLAYRAFYAMPRLSNSSGLPTQAILGVVNMILKILKEENPSHMIVCFDREVPSFRLEIHQEYKANREKPPDDFLSQLPWIKKFFGLLRIPVIEEAGFEADDCIATLVKQAEPLTFDISILSGDLDLLQLVSEQTQVLAGKGGAHALTRYTVEEVKKRYSLNPSQIADLKALVGDPSDNIRGVPGLGEKSAAKLLQTWGDLARLLTNTEKLSEKLRLRIENNHEKILLNKNLIALRTDVPISFQPEQCEVSPLGRYVTEPLLPLPLDTPDAKEALQAFFEELEFNHLLKKLGLSRPVTAQSAVQFDFIESEEKIGELTGKFQQSEKINLLSQEHHLAVGFGEGEIWVIAPHLVTTVLQVLVKLPPQKEATVYDWKAFYHIFKQADLPVPAWEVRDLLILGWLCNSAISNPSLTVLLREFGQPPVPESGGNLPAKLAAEISAMPSLALELNTRTQAMQLEKVYREIEFPLIPVLGDLEREGVTVDLQHLHRLSREFQEELSDLERKIYAEAGTVFNINSSRQLAQILYEKFRLPPGKKTKTGYSTNVEELERLQTHSPLADMLLQHREVSKLKNTYADVFPQLVNQKTGRLHTTYVQTGTATGRLSSKNPNLQNIPIRTPYGKKIRQAFVAGKEGWKMMSADYSQIELRLLAHFSQDPKLKEAFENQEDIHARTAAEVFGIPREEVTPELRRAAKSVNFGIVYGMTEHGLSQNLGMKKEEAREYIRNYFFRFPQVQEFIQSILESAREHGGTRTLLGRFRPIPELHTRSAYLRQEAERIAVNAPLQGSAADLIKLAMIRVHEKIKQRGWQAKMVTQVHDELVFEVSESEERELAKLVKKEMEQVFPLQVPLVADISTGKNWSQMQPLGNFEIW